MSLSTTSAIVWAGFDQIVNSIRFRLPAKYSNEKSEEKHIDIDRFFKQVIDYLNQDSIPHSVQSSYHRVSMSCIAVKGIKIVYQKTRETKLIGDKVKTDWGYIEVSISPHNFIESFEVYRNICMLLEENTTFYLLIRLNNLYSYIVSDEDCSALVASVPEWFTFNKDLVGSYICDDLGLKFGIYDINRYDYGKSADFVLRVIFDPQKNYASNIIELISRLYDLKLIYKKTGEQNNA